MNLSSKTIYLATFNLCNTLTQFALIILLSRYYSKVDYATYRQTFLPFEVLSPALGLGLVSSIFYFFPRYSDKESLVARMLFLLGCSALAFEVILLAGGSRLLAEYFNNEALFDTLKFTGVFAMFSLSNALLYSFFILKDRPIYITRVNIFFNLLLITVILFLVYINADIVYSIYARILVYFGILFCMCAALKVPPTSLNLVRFKKDYREILGYSLPIAVSALVGTLSYQLGSIIVSTYSSPANFAIFVNGAIEVPVIAIITSSIGTVALGAMTSLIHDEKLRDALVLFKESTKYSAIIIFPVFSFLLSTADHVILLFFGEQYSESAMIFKIYLLLLPIRIVYYGNALVALNKTKTLLMRSVIELVLNIVACLILFKYWGIFGVAFGNVLSTYLWTVPYNLMTIAGGFKVRLIDVLPYGSFVRIMASAVGSMLPLFLVKEIIAVENRVFLLAIFFLVFCTFYLSLSYVLKVFVIDRNHKYKIKLL